MTIRATLKNYYKTVMKYATTIETFKLFSLKSSKQKQVLLLQLWAVCLKGEIPHTTSEMFKFLRERKKELYTLV